MGLELELVRAYKRYLEHLQGKHNQKSHGRRYTTGADGKRVLKGRKQAQAVQPKTNVKTHQNQKNTDPATWKERLTTREEQAVKTYTGMFHATINGQLRKGEVSNDTKGIIDLLDSALEKSRLTKDTQLFEKPQLFRAAEIPEVEAAIKGGNLKGLEFTDKGFVSTSRTKQSAETFKRGKARMFVINAPSGTKAGDVASLGGALQGEDEILLARNTSFKVARVEKVKEKVPYRDMKGRTKYRTKTVEYIHLDITGQS